MSVGDAMSSDSTTKELIKREPYRPQTYTDDELIEKTKAYITDGYQEKDIFPSIVGLAINLGIHRDTIYQRAKENKDFSDIIDILRMHTEKDIIQNALKGTYNSGFATFYCKARLGMKENDAPQTQQVNIQVVTNGEQAPMIQVG